MICEYERKYEKNAVEGVEISCEYVNFKEFWMISPRILQIFVCCQALAEGLKHNSALANLILYNNNIGATGAQAWCLVRMVKMGRCTTVRIETQLFESDFLKEGDAELI